MTPLTALEAHQTLCDELYQLAIEENRHLRQHQRAPESALLERKRKLLERLNEVVDRLRAIPAGSVRAAAMRDGLEKNRARLLQIIQLDQENEHLLLRVSMVGERAGGAAPARPPASMLQRIYARTA